MMEISKKQCAIINSACKPFKITTRYLGPRLQHLLHHYFTYFSRRRHQIPHFTPKHNKNNRLVLLFNCLIVKGGFAKRRHRLVWNFCGLAIKTKRGKRVQRKLNKKTRRNGTANVATALKEIRNLPLKTDGKQNAEIVIQKGAEGKAITVAAIEQNQGKAETSNVTDTTNNPRQIETVNVVNPKKRNVLASIGSINGKAVTTCDSGPCDSEPVDNIWNLDLGKVAALMTDGDLDDTIDRIESAVKDNSHKQKGSNAMAADVVKRSLCVKDSNRIGVKSKSNPITPPTPIPKNGIATQIIKVSNEIDSTAATDINEKLRQQLKLLKMGKGETFLFGSKSDDQAEPISIRRGTITFSRRPTIDETKKSVSANNSNMCSLDRSEDDHCKKTLEKAEKCKQSLGASHSPEAKSAGGVIDSLFNKLKSISKQETTNDVTTNRRSTKRIASNALGSGTASTKPKQAKQDVNSSTSSIRHERKSSVNRQMDDSNQEDSDHSTSSAMEFLGFDISNKNLDVSALLPTPKVSTSNRQSIFVSEDLDTFMKENSLENVANVDIALAKPKLFNFDEALITVDAEPPNLPIPERPMDMQRARTLAEKRMILQQQNDFSYLIIENESTVYHELKKRVKFGANYNSTLLQNIQNANIPFTRDCWRATCWITTGNNRFFYRTINLDGHEIKLTGSRGNNENKLAFKIVKDSKQHTKLNVKWRTLKCDGNCLPIENIKINNIGSFSKDIKLKMKHTAASGDCSYKRRLNMFSREYMKPGPKCKKTTRKRSSLDIEYGPLEIVKLPTVQLELWPQIGLSLPDSIKSLLKTFLPDGNLMTPQWAHFAMSMLKENPKPQKHRRKYKKPERDPPNSFLFDIPFEHNEKKIMLRRRRRPSIAFNAKYAKREQIEAFYRKSKGSDMQFAKHIDRTDALTVECADILTNMIDSVAIAVNEANFIQNDPDIDYVGKIMSISDMEKEANKVKDVPCGPNWSNEKDKSVMKTENSNKKQKLMKELKRLNVTVIDTDEELMKSQKVETVCNHVFCRLGCICNSIESPKYMQTHCQMVDCMFGCICTNLSFAQAASSNQRDDIDTLQAKANAYLAKEEKEFKATIVVSENDMFVLPNSTTAIKRSSRKPKRFTECMLSEENDNDDDLDGEFNGKTKRHRHSERTVECNPLPPLDNKYEKKLLESLQHVSVTLEKLPDLNVEPWCMVHCLYKCHCGGKSHKGHPFSFVNHNGKNEVGTKNGWENISPRKRQYTFERGSELHVESDVSNVGPLSTPTPPKLQKLTHNVEYHSARTHSYIWKSLPRKTIHEMKKELQSCFNDERKLHRKLSALIAACRSVFRKENNLKVSKRFTTDQVFELSDDDDDDVPATVNAAHTEIKKNETAPSQVLSTPRRPPIKQLDQVITLTMRHICDLMRTNTLKLGLALNKLSIVRWGRILTAFNTREVFIWEVWLPDKSNMLVLTDSCSKPQSPRFVRVSNINYVLPSKLPMVGQLLRKNVCNNKTEHMAMVLLRLPSFWRVIGVVHSDLNYLNGGIYAKPTPDKNPLLSRKIETLHTLLAKRDLLTNKNPMQYTRNGVQASGSIQNPAMVAVQNGKPPKDYKVTTNGMANAIGAPETSNASTALNSLIAQNNDVSQVGNIIQNITSVKVNDNVTTTIGDMNLPTMNFVNASQGLELPLPVNDSQRLLRLSIGDDFTHIWLGRKTFISAKRIQSSLAIAKAMGNTIQMNGSNNLPKVFVTHTHDNSVFIGPYGLEEKPNLALFVRHEGHMILSEKFCKLMGVTCTTKTKVSWIYSTNKCLNTDKLAKSDERECNSKPNVQTRPAETVVTPPQPLQIKINQVFSKNKLIGNSKPIVINQNGHNAKFLQTISIEALNKFKATAANPGVSSISVNNSLLTNVVSMATNEPHATVNALRPSGAINYPIISHCASGTTAVAQAKLLSLAQNAPKMPVIRKILNNGASIKVFDLSNVRLQQNGNPNAVFKFNSIQNSTDQLQLKISSVRSGDSASLIANTKAKLSNETVTNPLSSAPIRLPIDPITITNNVDPIMLPIDPIATTDTVDPLAIETIDSITSVPIDENQLDLEEDDAKDTDTPTRNCSAIFNKSTQKGAPSKPTIESINIDDSTDDDEPENDASPKEIVHSTINSKIIKRGFIFCETNADIGKLYVECTEKSIKLIRFNRDIKNPTAGEYELKNINEFMDLYIQAQYYVVYPVNLKLNWIFSDVDEEDHKPIKQHQIRSFDKNSVVFKDKIVSISSNYQDDETLTLPEVYVLDCFKLANQICTHVEAKTMSTSEIIKKASDVAKTLTMNHKKILEVKSHYERMVKSYLNKGNKKIQSTDLTMVENNNSSDDANISYENFQINRSPEPTMADNENSSNDAAQCFEDFLVVHSPERDNENSSNDASRFSEDFLVTHSLESKTADNDESSKERRISFDELKLALSSTSTELILNAKRSLENSCDSSMSEDSSAFASISSEALKKRRGRPPVAVRTVLTASECKNLSATALRYLQLRHKNNEASRLSRMRRKRKFNEIMFEVNRLEKTNRNLSDQLKFLSNECHRWRRAIFRLGKYE